jgi:hypothetical protein
VVEAARALLWRCAYDSEQCPHTPLIVLLNGAEELVLLGADAFVKRHPHLKIGAFLNIESTGSTGRPFLFQHSGDSMLLREYFNNAYRPAGSVLAEELYRFIPALTDFQVLSRKAPGIDIALVLDGASYHTSRDSHTRLDAGCMQALGDSLLNTLVPISKRVAEREEANVTTAVAIGNESERTADAEASEHGQEGAKNARTAFADALGGRFTMKISKHHLLICSQQPLFAVVSSFLNRRLRFRSICCAIQEALQLALSVFASVASACSIAYLRVRVGGSPMFFYASLERAAIMYIPAALAGLMATVPIRKLQNARRASTLLFGIISPLLLTLGDILSASGLFFLIAIAAGVSTILTTNANVRAIWQVSAQLASACTMFVPASLTLSTALLSGRFLMDKSSMMGSTETCEWIYDVASAMIVSSLTAIFVCGCILPITGLPFAHVKANAVQRRCRYFMTFVLLIISAASSVFWRQESSYSMRKPKRVVLVRQQNLTRQDETASLAIAGLDGMHLETFMPNSTALLPESLAPLDRATGTHILGALEPKSQLAGDVLAFGNAHAAPKHPRLDIDMLSATSGRIKVASNEPFALTIVAEGGICGWSVGQKPVQRLASGPGGREAPVAIANVHVLRPSRKLIDLFSQYKYSFDIWTTQSSAECTTSNEAVGLPLELDVFANPLGTTSQYLEEMKKRMPNNSDVTLVDTFAWHARIPVANTSSEGVMIQAASRASSRIL